jgi:hypothetical protein
MTLLPYNTSMAKPMPANHVNEDTEYISAITGKHDPFPKPTNLDDHLVVRREDVNVRGIALAPQKHVNAAEIVLVRRKCS